MLFTSCSMNPPREVEDVLIDAKENRPELQKVIDHYKNEKDKEKLQAAYFLIGNMKDKYSLEGEVVKKYDGIFDISETMRKNHIYIIWKSQLLQEKWDSIVAIKGRPIREAAESIKDLQHIKANYLINNIEAAFKTRRLLPWAKTISFTSFLEYVLPYRVSSEPLENWRLPLSTRYRRLNNTNKNKDSWQMAIAINSLIDTIYRPNYTFTAYPFDIPVSKMERSKRGTCRQVANYKAFVLRANGIPATVDYTPMWGNRNTSHEWAVAMKKDGKFSSLEAKSPHKPAKVYRVSFTDESNETDKNNDEIPDRLLQITDKDVTSEYTKAFDIKVPINISANSNKYAILSTFFAGNDWVPQDYGIVKNGNAYFKNIGSGIIYLLEYYNYGSYTIAGKPFLLDSLGAIHYFDVNENKHQNVTAYRKYPAIPQMIKGMASMVGCKFQGANNSDFRDSVDLYTVRDIPSKIEEAMIDNKKAFRYIRCKTNTGAAIAEIEIYYIHKNKITLLSGKPIGFPQTDPKAGYAYQRAFDKNYETYTYISSKDKSWTGIDLGKPEKISSIKYVPSSDCNFIFPGDTYELCYWKNNKWTSVGKQVAASAMVSFKNVPQGGLYILHDLSQGKEERIFTYENGRQIWW